MQNFATAFSCLKPVIISIYITNLGKYNEGELIGEWLELPITSDELQTCLFRIGIDGIRYEEYFLTDYESSFEGVSAYISQYSSLDELNYLATKLEALSSDEATLYQAAITLGDVSSLADLINLTDNLEAYQLLDDVNNEYDLGYYWIEESGCYDLSQLGSLASYIDYERFGRDICLEQSGAFCDEGYLYHTGKSFVREYDGTHIPQQYQLSSY